MKVLYQSPYITAELKENSIFRVVPSKGIISIKADKKESIQNVLCNGELIPPEHYDSFSCKNDVTIIIYLNGLQKEYKINSYSDTIQPDIAELYGEFCDAYVNGKNDVVKSIKKGSIKVYAAEQSTEIPKWMDLFNKMDAAFKHFQLICDKPKSHLKSINEVRPIETVKRVGYESIPYLASHSEDWLARTATGLKPARLFSRVEDDEYQIYENRVVKTLIDSVVDFLRREERNIYNKSGELKSIYNSRVRMDSFGFDLGYSIAVGELIGDNQDNDEVLLKKLKEAQKLHEKALMLLRKYRTLKKSRLYRYLIRSKKVTNPLNETNILLMDKDYKEIYSLWKSMPKRSLKEKIEVKNEEAVKKQYDGVRDFCETICTYAIHSLHFKKTEINTYVRDMDNIGISLTNKDGILFLSVYDMENQSMEITAGLTCPISNNETYKKFSRKGDTLYWDKNIQENDIEEFCSLFQNNKSKSKERAEENRRYRTLKKSITEAQMQYHDIASVSFAIVPTIASPSLEKKGGFVNFMENVGERICEENNLDYIVIALPLCGDAEQKMTRYPTLSNKVSFAPITMFDINSYRRVQNVLLRAITRLSKDKCPYCTSNLYNNGEVMQCRECGISVIKTKCSNPVCKYEYKYLSYEANDVVLDKMSKIDETDFYNFDTMFQYKNIVTMSAKNGKIRPVCPKCNC